MYETAKTIGAKMVHFRTCCDDLTATSHYERKLLICLTTTISFEQPTKTATDTAPNRTVSPFTLSCFTHLVFLFFFYLNCIMVEFVNFLINEGWWWWCFLLRVDSGECHLGYERGAINGKSWYELIHPEDIAEASSKHLDRKSTSSSVCLYVCLSVSVCASTALFFFSENIRWMWGNWSKRWWGWRMNREVGSKNRLYIEIRRRILAGHEPCALPSV